MNNAYLGAYKAALEDMSFTDLIDGDFLSVDDLEFFLGDELDTFLDEIIEEEDDWEYTVKFDNQT